MKENDRDKDWAWERVEAVADDSLEVDDRRRMRDAMNSDPKVRKAVANARSLRKSLRLMPQQPVPAGLLMRLLRIPSDRPWTWRWYLVSAVPAIAAAVAYVTVVRAPLPSNDQSIVALQEFRLAMSYVRRSAEVTHEELSAAIEDGLREAYGISRDSIVGENPQFEQGDQADD